MPWVSFSDGKLSLLKRDLPLINNNLAILINFPSFLIFFNSYFFFFLKNPRYLRVWMSWSIRNQSHITKEIINLASQLYALVTSVFYCKVSDC